MAFSILGTPKPQFFDSSGAPLVNGTVSVLNPADDTNKASYPSYDDAEAATNANDNPITLDSRGEPSVGLWGLDAEDYKIRVQDADGATIWTVDDITMPAVTQAGVTAILYKVTAAETTAGITPSSTLYPEGNVLRYGADPTGATDSTNAFAEVLEAGGFHVIIPTGTYEVDPSAWDAIDNILVGSNTVIECEPGVTVRVPTGGGTADRGFIRFRDVSNCVVIGNMSVWEYETKPTTEEQRHIFDIRGGTNIAIRDTIARNSGGDGYYVGAGAVAALSTNIFLSNIEADNCRRQGLSIVSARTCHVYGAKFKDITGASPQSGVDVEPNSNDDVIEDIVLDGIYTENCDGNAILVALQSLDGAADKIVSVKITNCTDNGSDIGLAIRGGAVGAGLMSGKVTFTNCQTRNNTTFGRVISNWPFDGVRGEFIDCAIFQPNEAALVSDSLGSAVYMQDDDTQDAIGFHGNLLFHNDTVIDDRSSPNVTNYYYLRATKTGTHDGSDNAAVLTDSTAAWTTNAFVGAKLTNVTDDSDGIITANTATTITATLAGGTDDDWDDGDEYVVSQLVKDVHITGTTRLEGQSTGDDQIYFDGTGLFHNDLRQSIKAATASYTLSPSNYVALVTNEGAAGLVTITLDNVPAGFPEVTFEVLTAQNLRIDPDAASHIYPGSNGVGFYVQSNEIGAKITLRRKSRTEWFIVNEIGTWTRET